MSINYRCICLLKTVTIHLALFASSFEDDQFIFKEKDSPIQSSFQQTTAYSKVTDWDVFLHSSSAILGVESFVPVDEQGFWIVGFVSRPVQDVYAMISNLGQMKMLKDEYRNGYCSSLPYFYNYTISDILENDSLYKEDNSGEPLSIFDWRSRPPYNPIIAVGGNEYDKSALKAMSATLRTLMNCMNMSSEYKDGAVVYKKNLFHTYIRIKEDCVNVPRFDATQCIEILERSTLLVWKLTTHILVDSSIATTAHEWVTESHHVTAGGYDMSYFQYSSAQGTEVVEGEVSLNLTFSVAEDEYYFYIPQSFRITGPYFLDSDGLDEWVLLDITNINLTEPLQFVTVKQNVDIEIKGDNHITSEIYTKYLAGTKFPISLLPRGLSDTISFQFKFVNGWNKTREKVSVKQEFGFITCNSEVDGVTDQMCRFGHTLTTISTGVVIEVESETQAYYTAETEVSWSIRLLSVSAGNGDNIGSQLNETLNRPLYSSESLFVDFSIYPKYVLKNRDIHLMYLTLTLLSNNEYSYSYLIYMNSSYESEAPPNLAGYQDRQLDSFGQFSCSSTGICSLMLVSEVFATSPTGKYTLTLALKLEDSDKRSKRSSPPQITSELDSESSTQSFELDFGYEIKCAEHGRSFALWNVGSSWVNVLGFWWCLRQEFC
ncbi:uncharacterized protein LOC134813547 [Bolinopsis microptera]|uniref:uncharacterized protein LOC134813547 n=1 Tax=Bolinopsis microptera TaxID=2820187 RepID=UPI003078BDF3